MGEGSERCKESSMHLILHKYNFSEKCASLSDGLRVASLLTDTTHEGGTTPEQVA